MKKFLALILAISMVLPILAITGCGPTSEDPGNDPGGDTPPADGAMLEIIKDGTANYTIVYDHTLSTAVIEAITSWKSKLEIFNIEFTSVAGYDVTKAQDKEILIGSTFSGRDGYSIDMHQYGIEGYAIKAQDSKILINGGSDAALIAAIKMFFENYVGCVSTATLDSLMNVSITKSLLVEHKQQYDVTDVSVAGVSIRDAYIRAAADGAERAAAQILQSALYSTAGIWLDIKKPNDASGKKIIVEMVEDAGEDGFRVFIDNGTLTIQCAYENALPGATEKFLEKTLDTATAAYDYPATYSLSLRTNVVYYSDFGADVYGSKDSFIAMRDAHAFANISGQPVMADEGATYYIGIHRDQIVVQTDTDWKDARIIIDDANLVIGDHGYHTFYVAPTKAAYKLDISKLTIDTAKFNPASTNIGLTFADTVMLKVENSTKKVYRRTNGEEANMQDLILVDKNGNIDQSTPLTFTYDTVTDITVYSAYDKPITLKGGSFETRANRIPSAGYVGVNRGISIQRSNTTLENVRHYVTNEPTAPSSSMPYGGFYHIANVNNVTLKDCVLCGHRVYQNTLNGSWNGSYDTTATNSNAVSWLNCKQMTLEAGKPVEQSITSNTYWGVIGTNFSKNLTIDNCRFSRFDAHCGVYNVTVTNSEIGYQTLNFVGNGLAYFENTTVHAGQFVSLRADYGATWNGEIVIKNCALRVGYNDTSAPVVAASWSNWDFGYECHLPNVTVDGFKVYRPDGREDTTINKCIFAPVKSAEEEISNVFDKNSEGNINPFYLPTKLEINLESGEPMVFWTWFWGYNENYNAAEKAMIDAIPKYVNGVLVEGEE